MRGIEADKKWLALLTTRDGGGRSMNQSRYPAVARSSRLRIPATTSPSFRRPRPEREDNPQAGSDAYSSPGDRDRDGLSRAGGGPYVRSSESGLPAPVQLARGQPIRMQLHVAASVQRVGIWPRGAVRHQSIFRGRGRARGSSKASPRLLKNEPYRAPHWADRAAGSAHSTSLSCCPVVASWSRSRMRGTYITRLLKAEHEAPEWQAATKP
jgi:hypothetical protein